MSPSKDEGKAKKKAKYSCETSNLSVILVY